MQTPDEHLSIPYKRIPNARLWPELQALQEAAAGAATTAYAPYSHFRVGAALQLSSGQIVVGSNQENAAYPSGLCAERTALFAAGAQYPGETVQTLLLLAVGPDGERVREITPCGACRQVMQEVSARQGTSFRVVLCGAQESILIEDNRLLLPFAFSL